jgi:MFS family permease
LASIQYGASFISGLLLTNYIDKMDKATLLYVVNGCLITSLVSMIIIDDPCTDLMIPSMIALGVGIGGMYLMTFYLIARYSPEEHRGKVYGALSLIGNSSILICALAGGYLFDIWTKNAQFLIYSSFSLLAVCILTCILISFRRHRAVFAKTLSAEVVV